MTTAWDYLAAFITIGALAIGLISMLVGVVSRWLERRPSLPAPRVVMSRRRLPVQQSYNRAESAFSTAKLNNESAETPQRVAENSAESFTLGETQALARLVASGKLGLTEAVKIGADAKSGEKYQKRSREIKAAVEKMQNKFPQRTHGQDVARRQLGIDKR